MEKVVSHPLKIDLHIHSAASGHKDGKLVANNTTVNLDRLIAGLERHEVNLAAITDHDCFDYELYTAFRKAAQQSPTLEKIFPGIEFSVMFERDGETKPIHVVTIFNDVDEDALRSISQKIPMKNSRPSYDNDNAFSEAKYWEIIRSIGLDVVIIAHQKATLDSKHKKKNDANSLGREQFNEFLFLEYFEAYEYKNRRNQLFNRAWTYMHKRKDKLRFITGSDCHDWLAYPNYSSKGQDDFEYTYLKCLPTFRGLAMAVTDEGRIKTVPSFFSSSPDWLHSIDLEIKGEEVHIPLSPGINAIIGDNSIGKSCLVNAITGYKHVQNTTVKKGYQNYLKKMGIEVLANAADSNVAAFDGQSSIRNDLADLANNKGKAKNKLGEHFPKNEDIAIVLQYALGQINAYVDAVKTSCDLRIAEDSIPTFKMLNPEDSEPPHNLVIQKNLSQVDHSAEGKLLSDIGEIGERIRQVSETHESVLTSEDMCDLKTAREALQHVERRHKTKKQTIERENKIANAITAQANALARKINKSATDIQKNQATYAEDNEVARNAICQAIYLGSRIRNFSFSDEVRIVEPAVNHVADYRFIARSRTKQADAPYFSDLVARVLKSAKTINVPSATFETVKEAILRYPDNDERESTEVLRERLTTEAEKDFSEEYAILRDSDKDLYSSLSEGFNARIYFTLMADEQLGRGAYIVDQPEDQISQKSIKSSVLEDFRHIAQARQVILITHNPQFIVNLDVDNVVYLSKQDDTLSIKSGALEYEENDYRMIDIVADNIEGGLETIRRRMKRYEKAN